ncbi:hypothetical protein [Ruegeria sp. HKCCA5763]|uniref:hypothetical protein n=1 Tax=Ruegeria sp. HKCCA5763 TaxID=2682987 RepID=UPI00148A0085|nr:hypothetical protein [Ruegeria sp. HKCCA5763]
MPGVKVHCGIGNNSKEKVFDLGTQDGSVLVECKAHPWAETNRVPSAKLTTWRQEMLYFLTAKRGERKILAVQHNINEATGESLADYFRRLNSHLIPLDVEIIESGLETYLFISDPSQRI